MKRLTKIAGAAIASLALILTGAIPAQAAEIANPVQTITTERQTAENPRPAYEAYENTKITFTGVIPDGSVTGDTFSITAPDSLHIQDTTGFSIRDTATAEAIATGVWDGQNHLTFTLNDFITTHTNVTFTGFFTAGFTSSGGATDTDLDLLFTLNGGATITAPVTILAAPAAVDCTTNLPEVGDPYFDNEGQFWTAEDIIDLCFTTSVSGAWTDNEDKGVTTPRAAIQWSTYPVPMNLADPNFGSLAYPDGFEVSLRHYDNQRMTEGSLTVTDRHTGLPFDSSRYTMTTTETLVEYQGQPVTYNQYDFSFTSLAENEQPYIVYTTDLITNAETTYAITVQYPEGASAQTSVARNLSGGIGDGEEDEDYEPIYTVIGWSISVFEDTNRDGVRTYPERLIPYMPITFDDFPSKPADTDTGKWGSVSQNDFQWFEEDGNHNATATLAAIPEGWEATTPITRQLFIWNEDGTYDGTPAEIGIAPPVEDVTPPVEETPEVVPPVEAEEEAPVTPTAETLPRTGESVNGNLIALTSAILLAGLFMVLGSRRRHGKHV